jgi:plastocyanin
MGIRPLLTVLLALGALAFFVTGCGGDDDDDTAATEATTTEEAAAGGGEAAAGGGGAPSVSMTEYAFDPSDLTVSEGDLIEVTNDGELSHNMTIEGQDLATSDLEPGTSQQLLLGNGTTLPPGEYEFVCTIGDHAEQGMTGTLTVE